jgi:RHS repeat-associated protein
MIALQQSPVMMFSQGDHLGSTTLITDSSGAEIAYQEYLPFGASLPGGSTGEERLYTGQQLDNTGIYYYGARYYDPELRRFISPDPIMDPYNPQNLNRYSYVLNNPYRYTDPTGMFVCGGLCVGAVALAASTTPY